MRGCLGLWDAVTVTRKSGKQDAVTRKWPHVRVGRVMMSTNSPPSPSPLFHALALSRWILSPDKWGGAIELSILCAHYAREIAAYDIRTQRCDLYGQGAGEGHVCMDMHGYSGAWTCMGAVVHGCAWAQWCMDMHVLVPSPSSQSAPFCFAASHPLTDPLSGYSERVMLIYDGLHYDALAVSAFQGEEKKVSPG